MLKSKSYGEEKKRDNHGVCTAFAKFIMPCITSVRSSRLLGEVGVTVAESVLEDVVEVEELVLVDEALVDVLLVADVWECVVVWRVVVLDVVL